MSNNTPLHNSHNRKIDDYYTTYEDVEKELKYYKAQFKDKVVYCNADDYRYSYFVRYFKENFNELHLKKLICSCYNKNGGVAQIYSYGWAETLPLFGDGDFRSEECIEFLKECDIVVTNPPFSLFRDYFNLLTTYKKDFLILANINAITYKEIFPFLQNGTFGFGVTKFNAMSIFYVDDDFVYNNEKKKIIYKGRNAIRVNNITWLTTLKNEVKPNEVTLHKKYNETDYPKYDNYDAIDVSITKDIPYDYYGYIGVPITALKYYYDGAIHFANREFKLVKFRKGDDNKDLRVDGKDKYFRIIIK